MSRWKTACPQRSCQNQSVLKSYDQMNNPPAPCHGSADLTQGRPVGARASRWDRHVVVSGERDAARSGGSGRSQPHAKIAPAAATLQIPHLYQRPGRRLADWPEGVSVYDCRHGVDRRLLDSHYSRSCSASATQAIEVVLVIRSLHVRPRSPAPDSSASVAASECVCASLHSEGLPVRLLPATSERGLQPASSTCGTAICW